MKHKDLKRRDILLYRIWQEFKNAYSMQDLSDLLEMNLYTLYKSIRKGKEAVDKKLDKDFD